MSFSKHLCNTAMQLLVPAAASYVTLIFTVLHLLRFL